MDRINRILENKQYMEYLVLNELAERDRKFCHHDIDHFMDVARIGMILNLEEQIKIDRELLYGAALLHDIGRFKQYQDGTPHEKASAKLAGEILSECGFNDLETRDILSAIKNHRNSRISEERNLDGILYQADKLSRACFACKAEKACSWKGDKKNLTIKY